MFGPSRIDFHLWLSHIIPIWIMDGHWESSNSNTNIFHWELSKSKLELSNSNIKKFSIESCQTHVHDSFMGCRTLVFQFLPLELYDSNCHMLTYWVQQIMVGHHYSWNNQPISWTEVPLKYITFIRKIWEQPSSVWILHFFFVAWIGNSPIPTNTLRYWHVESTKLAAPHKFATFI